MKAFPHELWHAVRQLRIEWRFTLVVTGLLGISIGAVGALYSLTRALVWRPLPIAGVERLVALYPVTSIGTSLGIPYSTLAALDSHQQTLEHLCGFTRGSLRLETIDGISTQPMEAVTGRCYEQWGVRAVSGRLIGEADAPLLGDALPVVVVSFAFWQRLLGSDPAAVGRTLKIEGVALTVIGVTPPGFGGLFADQAPALTIPLSLLPKLVPNVIPRALWAVGRLRPGTPVLAAQAELNSNWRQIWESTNPPGPPGSRPVAFAPLKIDPLGTGFSDLRQRYRDPLVFLSCLGTVLLSLVSLNVGALFLTRTIGRTQDMAVQLALGADKRRLLCRIVGETVLLSVAALCAGAPLAWWFSQLIANNIWTGSLPLTMRVTPDGSVLAGMAALSAGSGLLMFVPSLFYVRHSGLTLDASAQRATSFRTSRLTRVLVAVQVTASLVLLFCATLFFMNLRAIRNVDPGFVSDGLLWTRLEPLPAARRDSNAGIYLRQVIETVSATGKASDVAFALRFPTADVSVPPIPVAHVRGETDQAEIGAIFDLVSPEFFSTTKIAFLQGRTFSWQDTPTQPNVAIVNASLASRLFSAKDPLGQQIRVGRPPGGRTATIVGIVADASPGDPRLTGTPVVYTPLLQQPVFAAAPYMLVRATSGQDIFSVLRASIGGLGRHFIVNVRSADEQIERLLIRERMLVRLSAAFAGLGLLISALGLYATLSYTVIRRGRELGVRMALGATERRLVVMLSAEGMSLVLLGILIGLPLALGAGNTTRALLFHVSPLSPRPFFAASGLIVIVGLLACVIPSSRAANREIARALRDE